MYHRYDEKMAIHVPKPFNRTITPICMKNDEKDCSFSVHMTEWEPGGKVDLHEHRDATEAMYCISGRGRCSVDGKEYELIPGGLMVALPHVTHDIENTGRELLRVLCIFSPAMEGEDLRKRALEAVENENGKMEYINMKQNETQK